MNIFVWFVEGKNSVWRYFFFLLVIVGLFLFGSILIVFYMFFIFEFNLLLMINWDELVLGDLLVDIYL